MRRPDRFTDEPGITADGGAHTGYAASSGHAESVLRCCQQDCSRLSSLVPVQAVRAVSDDVRQLYSPELEERTGVRLRANSISDGTLKFLALTAIAEATDATGVYCMEEPGNGIHPEKLAAMNQLLHDIAVDLDERVDSGNPLWQVIVATHSPYFVQLQSPEELVIAKNPAVRASAGEAIWPLRCYPLAGTWRVSKQQPDKPAVIGLGKLELQSYLLPPEDAQLRFPDEFWPQQHQEIRSDPTVLRRFLAGARNLAEEPDQAGDEEHEPRP